MSGIKFWGYLHTSGTIHVKRLFDKRDIEEAQESPFVAHICPVFEVNTTEEAYKHVNAFFKKDTDETTTTS